MYGTKTRLFCPFWYFESTTHCFGPFWYFCFLFEIYFSKTTYSLKTSFLSLCYVVLLSLSCLVISFGTIAPCHSVYCSVSQCVYMCCSAFRQQRHRQNCENNCVSIIKSEGTDDLPKQLHTAAHIATPWRTICLKIRASTQQVQIDTTTASAVIGIT